MLAAATAPVATTAPATVRPTATPSTGPIAVDDALRVPADRLLQTNVTSNDVNVSPLSNFAFYVVQTATYTTSASSTPVALPAGSLQLGTGGQVYFNPFTAGSLKAGTVVTFVYNIQPPYLAGTRPPPRSNNATVTITITDPGEPSLGWP